MNTDDKVYRCTGCFRFFGKDLMNRIHESTVTGICKKCNNLSAAMWRADNPERSRKLQLNWARKNRDYVNSVNRKAYRKNSVAVIKRTTANRKKDPKRYNEYCYKWQRNNKDKHNAVAAAYRARKRAAYDPDVDKEAVDMIYKYATYLSKITGVMHAVDHIIPMGPAGGKHHEDNLQILTMAQNSVKGNKLNTNIVGPRIEEVRKFYYEKNRLRTV